MEKRKIHSFLFVIAALILTLTVAFGLTACGETDDESPGGGFVYMRSEDGGYTVTGVTDTSASELVVPESYLGESVVAVSEGAFANCTSATKIVIPDSVKSIGKGALRGCRSLAYLSIPFTGQSPTAVAEKSVLGFIFGQSEYVGAAEVIQTFGELPEDNEIYYIPASLRDVEFTGTTIPYGAFSNCNFISTFTVGACVTSIDDAAFSGNGLAYVYVDGDYVASTLVGPVACGGLLSNMPAVCLKEGITRLSGYVESMDTKSDRTYGGKNYSIYANKKFYRFEAEKAVLGGGLSTGNAEFGANGVPTGGGYYVTGFYPNGGTGNCYMEFRITASKDTKAKFVYCCGARPTHYFNSCYKITVNDTAVVPENDVKITLPAGESYMWSQWTRYEIMEVDLKAGENVFHMRFTPDGKETAENFSNDMYVDYIEFETDAILTWTN